MGLYEPLSLTQLTNPYEAFQKLRTDQPLFYDETLKMWIVTRYDDAVEVLKDSRTYSNKLTLAPVFQMCPHAGQILQGLTMNPIAASDVPYHTRLRKVLSKVLPMTKPKAEKYEADIHEIITQLIQAMKGKKEADLVSEFSWKLPLLVIMKLLGIPEEDYEQLKRWSLGRLIVLLGHASEDEQITSAYGMVHLSEYCKKLVAGRIERPGTDWISQFIAEGQQEEPALTADEVAGLVFSLLIAGHETTSNLISNGVFQLLKRDGHWQQLVESPEKIPAAVEEMLRLDTPVIGWIRYSVKEKAISGVTIPKGERILVLLGSANHDEKYFTDAEEFQIDRPNASDHISFSKGRHYCIGAAFAKFEAKIAFEELTKHFPHLSLQDKDKTLSYLPNVGFRVLNELPVVLG